MAEQIPYGAASNIISTLASFAFNEFGRIYGVKDEMKKLQQTLESIKVVISSAELTQLQDPVNNHWITRFKQVLLDADDLLDDLYIKDLRRKVNDGGSESARTVREFFSFKDQIAFRANLARKIENIRKSFNNVADDMSKLKLNPSFRAPGQNESGWRETSSFVLPSAIIGREDDKSEIIDLLNQTDTKQNVSMIAIVGIGGLGKTALAQMVYNDADVKKLFHKQMWVCVSEDFEVKLLLKKMLKSLKDSEVGDLELDQLQKKLQEELCGQRYMIVLDDVWNEDHQKWDHLKDYLMCGGQGSKIVVTTRNTKVSDAMGITKTSYVLKGLNKKQSWSLLKNMTLCDDTNKLSPSLESIGERIAEKCGGVPLAIKTMGGILRDSSKECEEWLNILDDNTWRLSEGIMPVLKLSYQNLSLELRQCFAYCSLYPKDCLIPKDELIQLWMAQGYLTSSNERKSMEDVGNEYIKILLLRSFFQDAVVDDHNDLIEFKMHDLMHDLATLVAGNDCLLVAKGKGIVGRPMHVAFEDHTRCSLDMYHESKFRTLFRYPVTSRLLNSSFIEKLKYLRVLDWSKSYITQLPKSIDKVKHLRYFDLSGSSELVSLPQTIGNLIALQTLKLNWCSELVSLPESIGNLIRLQTLKSRHCNKLDLPIEVIPKLINLRYLEIDEHKAFHKMMPVGLGKLTSLQYLSNFVVGDNVKGECGKLNELKELNNIRGNLNIIHLNLVEDVIMEAQETNLKAKEHIQRLTLSWGDTETNKNSDSLKLLDNLCPHQNLRELSVYFYPGERFSSWLSTLTRIVKIKLYKLPCCQHLPPLERLPCLRNLKIRNMRELQCIHCEEISDVFFPSLEKLTFFRCENLRGWERLGDANKPNDISHHLSLPPFPRLSSLKIIGCPKLSCMPAFPHLVEKLELCDCSMKPLNETCLLQLEPSSLLPLSALRHLEIRRVREVEVKAMAENWMKNLTSLKSLIVDALPDIQHVLQHLQHLSSQLEKLEFKRLESDELCLQQLQSPFHCLRSLQKLIFSSCYDLRALPEEIRDLQSLRHIEIQHCPKLESLPKAMCRLTNLQSLLIDYCPLLNDRCKEDSGEDWLKIAHIPNRDIRRCMYKTPAIRFC